MKTLTCSKKNDRLGASDLDRKVVFDLYCENEKGEKFTVELQKAKQAFYDKLTFVTLQMPNFNKEEHELETNFDKWLFVIKNLHKLDRVPQRLQEKNFQKLFTVAAYTALSKEEKAKYEDSVKYYNDLKNSLDTAHQEGYTQAQEKLEQELKEERRQKEEAQRNAEKLLQDQNTLLKALYQAGTSLEQLTTNDWKNDWRNQANCRIIIKSQPY